MAFRTPFLAFLLLIASGCLQAQQSPEEKTTARTPAPSFSTEAYANIWPKYQERSLTHRRFKHKDIVPLIQNLPASFKQSVAGRSIEGRDIYQITIGSGSTKVLLWSQMHGDEPTATAALFDIFRFLSANDQYNELRQLLLNELTLVFIPMLNPDGAERYERRNALGIDLNRDALRRVSPESQILKQVRDELAADWGFNLHDQNRYYSAGFPSDQTASLSFLAPPINFQKDINDTRRNAMQLIALLHDALKPLAGGRMGRYSDDFEPRAFGDNMQIWGTRTVLVESGGYPDDPERQEVRKLNFALLLTALEAIAKKQFANYDTRSYDELPLNGSSNFHDLLVREVEVSLEGRPYLIDLAWRHTEVSYRGAQAYYNKGAISEAGDLSYFSAYSELAPMGLKLSFAKVYPTVLADANALKELDPAALLREGYGVVRLQRTPSPQKRDQLPLLIIGPDGSYDQSWRQGANPPVLLRNSANEVKYAVINWFLFDLNNLDLSQWRTLGQ
jgi:hypothetical protein